MADTTATQPSCFTSCSGSTDDAVIAADQCYIDGKCYPTGDSTTSFGKSCFVCDLVGIFLGVGVIVGVGYMYYKSHKNKESE
mmetsp:Transcript_29855/g.36338  ORF Transcript_29855/g.36338 Transcript_29855/m.36338 type:complete len:82 (-) Transcript_29855:23-268(-)